MRKLIKIIVDLILEVISYLILILLILFYLVSCSKIPSYVSQIKTHSIYQSTHTVPEVRNGQPLLKQYRAKY